VVLTVSEIFNDERDAMVDMTLIRPLNKGQGLVPIDFSYTTSYRLSQYILTNDDRQTQHSSISETVLIKLRNVANVCYFFHIKRVY